MLKKMFIYASGFLLLFAPAMADGIVKNIEIKKPFANLQADKIVYSKHIKKEDAPKLDGMPDDKCWENVAPRIFRNDSGTSKGQTEIRIIHSDENIYIAAKCLAASDKGIKHDAPPDNYDKAAYNDDCLDMFFVNGADLFQFILGAGGARSDSKNRNMAWDTEWQSAVRIGDDIWTAEIAIPLKAIGRRAKSGRSVTFNIGRATAPERIISSMFPGYANPEQMGLLVFGTEQDRDAYLKAYPEAMIKDMRFFLNKNVYDDMDEAAYGRIRLFGVSDQGRNKDNVKFELVISVLDAKTRKVVKSASLPLQGEVMDLELDTRSLSPGEYSVLAQIKNPSGKLILQKEYPLKRVKAAPVDKAGSIPLLADIPAETAKYISSQMPCPVYAGVPMPRGTADMETEYRLFDAAGNQLPCQTQVLSTWSPKGSVRWLGVNFQLRSAVDKKYTLKFGEKMPPAPAITASVSVKEQANSIFIDTGNARFEILKSGFDGIHQAWFMNGGKAGAPLLDAVSPYIADRHGKIYESSLDKNSAVSVEQSGPLCAVIKASGWFKAADGTGIAQYVMRIYAYAGVSRIKIVNTFIFCADSRDTKISDICIPLSLRDGIIEYRFGTVPEDMYMKENSASLLQYEKDKYKLFQNTGTICSVGEKADGWIEMKSAKNDAALAIGMRDFWQNYPKELEGERGRIKLHIWPEKGEDQPVKVLTDDNLGELWFMHHRKYLDFQAPEWFYNFKGKSKEGNYRYVRHSRKTNGMGVSKTNEIFVNLRKLQKDNVRAVATCINQPPIVYATPEWMCKSGAFGPIAPVDKNSFPVIEEALDARFDGERILEKYSYGMWNYGGSNTYFHPEKKSFSQLERPWRLTHHGSPRIPWLLFARSGQRKYFDYACRNTLRCADIGFCHYTTPEMQKLGYDGKTKGAQCDYKGIVPWSSGGRIMDYNSMSDFMHYYTYLTGERRPFDVSLEWGECTRAVFSPRSARSASGTLDTLLTLYEDTWDMDFRELAERQFDHIVDNIMTEDGYFRHGNWYDYAPWLSHYYRMTGSGKAEEKAVAWASRLIRDNPLKNMEYGADTCFIPQMGYPLYDVFMVAYAGTGNPLFLQWAQGCANAVGLSVLGDNASFMYGCDMYSRHSAGGYYQQTVPYILPLLKAHKGEFRAVYPRWELTGKKVTFFVKSEEKKPLELRFGIKDKKQAPDKAVIYSHDGKKLAQELKVSEDSIFTSGDGKNNSVYTYCKIILPPDMLDGEVKFTLERSDGKIFMMGLPMQSIRPVKMVCAWDNDLNFSRGSALYFQVSSDGLPVVAEALGRLNMPHSLAFLDDKDNVVAFRQWYYPEVSGQWIQLEAYPQADQRGKIWCCLQGLSKSLTIRMTSPPKKHYFSDRPERFFVPQE